MRCNVCDNILAPEEIKQNELTGRWEPCRSCIEASFDDLPRDEQVIDDDFDSQFCGC